MHISQKPEIQLLDTKAGGETHQHCPAAANWVAAISAWSTTPPVTEPAQARALEAALSSTATVPSRPLTGRRRAVARVLRPPSRDSSGHCRRRPGCVEGALSGRRARSPAARKRCLSCWILISGQTQPNGRAQLGLPTCPDRGRPACH